MAKVLKAAGVTVIILIMLGLGFLAIPLLGAFLSGVISMAIVALVVAFIYMGVVTALEDE